MAYEFILVEKEDGVSVITMNRPEVLNAMNRQLSSELHDAVVQANTDDEIGCIVITGTGDRAFSAGGDIHEQRVDARRSEEEQAALRMGREGWSYDISDSPEAGYRDDERAGIRGRGGALFIFGFPYRVREYQVPVPGSRIRQDQLLLDASQPDRLADGQGVAVYWKSCGGGGGLQDRSIEPPGAQGRVAEQDDGDRHDHRRKPPRVGPRIQATAARGYEQGPAPAIRERAVFQSRGGPGL